MAGTSRLPGSAGKWPVVLTLLAFALRVHRLDAQSLWLDEAFSQAVASVPIPLSIQALLSDGVHPPLYYLLLRGAITLLGQGEFALRFLSAWFGVLAVPLIYALGARYLGPRHGLLAALLLSLSPFHLWYSQEVRMYSIVVTLGLAAMYLFLRNLQEGKRAGWAAFIVVGASAYMTHYFALLLPLVQLVYLSITLYANHRSLRAWIVSQALAFVPLASWLFAVYTRQVMSFGISWIPRPGLETFFYSLWDFSLLYNGSDPLVVSLALLPFVALLLIGLWPGARTISAGGRLVTLFLAVWFLLPPVVIWALSVGVLPIYGDRFLIVVLPAYLLLLSSGLVWTWQRRRELGVLALSLLVVGMSVFSFRVYYDYSFGHEDWRAAVSYVNEQARDDDLVAMRQFQSFLPFDYYYRAGAEKAAITANLVTVPVEEVTRGRGRLWLLYRVPYLSSHTSVGVVPTEAPFEEDPGVRGWQEAHRCNLVDTQRFAGVYLMLYDLRDNGAGCEQ